MHEPASRRPVSVAYILKGFPRRSETFISSEIYRVERAGVPLHLLVLKPKDETEHHPVVDRIRARPRYLPRTGSLSKMPLPIWLGRHLGTFTPGAWRVLRRWPRGFWRAGRAAWTQAVRARKPASIWPRKIYLKEFLLATAVADRLRALPEVVHLHAHFCHGATTVAWLAALMTDLPFSFTAHAKDIYLESLNPAGLLKRKLRQATFVVTCTDANRRHLLDLEPGARVHRIYHGLNVDFERLIARGGLERRNGSTAVRLLAVGRLVPKKGFDVLVDACRLLAHGGLDFELHIAGERGQEESDLRARIQQYGLTSRIRLLGPLNQAQLVAEYGSATIFCLPCRIASDGDRDGVPNVLAEAMACALPVVTTPVSGIPELVRSGENGILVPPDEPAKLATVIQRLVSDPGLRQRLGQRARRTVREQFDGTQSAATLSTVFRSALPGARRW